MASLLNIVLELEVGLAQREISLFSGATSESLDLSAYISSWCAALKKDESRDIEYDETTETLAANFGAHIAKATHLEFHNAYEYADNESVLNVADIDLVEQQYNKLLVLSRVAAIRQSAVYTDYLFSLVYLDLFRSLKQLIAQAGVRASAQDHVNHIRVCDLASRVSMLGAFIPQLRSRVSRKRLRNSTKGIAERRTALFSERITNDPYVTSLSGLTPTEHVVFVGYVLDAQLVNRPRKPYTRLWINQSEELRVSYKNTRWLGVGDHQSVWVRCKVEPPLDGMNYMVAEFEGPTEMAGYVWESWIQQLVRDYYDIAPESIHWFCTFPPLISTLAPLFLSSRSFNRRVN